MTTWQEYDQSLPHGFDTELVRTVRIPRTPNRLDSSYDEYTLDMRNLFIINEQTIDFLLSHIPAWWATINQYAWRASTHAKVWKLKAIDKAIQQYGCSRTEAKSDFIHADHDYIVWEGQAQWLERMAKALSDVNMKLLQTYSANMRQQFQGGMSPYHS